MQSDINLTPTGSPFEIAREGQPITGRSWGNASSCKSGVLLVHGLGAHSGWFEAFARRLKVKQIYALAYDQIGFGKRRHQNFSSCQQWLDDLEFVYAYLREQVGERPIYLIGNSMGALVVHCIAPAVCPAGIALLSPGYAGNTATFTFGYRLKVMLKSWLEPDRELSLPYGSSSFVAAESTRAWVDHDPDCRLSVTGKMMSEVAKLSNLASRQAGLIKCPTLVVTAGMDKVVDNRAVSTIFDKLSIPSKRRKHFVDAYHDLLFDPAVDEVAKEVLDWMSCDSRCLCSPG